MHFRLLQLRLRNGEEGIANYAFRSYARAKQNGFNLGDYECTYEMEVDSDHSLDDFFEIFNIERPADFTGRSMSTSDIVELDGHKYYCDSIGWTDLDTEEKL